MENNKLEVKDFITLGIYNVIFVVIMLIAAITNLTPYTYLFYPFTGAAFCSIIFLLAVTKVPKRGSVLIMSLVMMIYLAATGVQGMISAVSLLVFGIITEIILGNKRKDSKRIMIAYIVFTFWMSIGGEFRLFVFPEDYFAEALQSGLDSAYVEVVRGMSGWGWWGISIAAGIIGAVLGMCVSKAVLKKHLQRAGIV